MKGARDHASIFIADSSYSFESYWKEFTKENILCLQGLSMADGSQVMELLRESQNMFVQYITNRLKAKACLLYKRHYRNFQTDV